MIGTWHALGLGLACAGLLAGCTSTHYFTVQPATSAGACQTAVPERDLLLGVALSGGGSRAALFGAAGMEALAAMRTADGAALIERISHLSSVSGGSLAATYYVLRKPGRDVRVLDADGSLSAPYRSFFARYRADVSQDFETSLIWRQLLSFRWTNTALAARILAEILGERLYGTARIEDVTAREKAGDSPGLIVNTTLYNNGRRFAVTTLPAEAFEYDFFQDLERSLRERGRPVDPAPYIRERWKLLRPMTPLEIGVDACPAGLPVVVTASASYPSFIGPVTLKIGDREAYWHAGDGGLYENSGAESLLFLYLKQLQARRAKRALIVVFDSSFPFSVGERRLFSDPLPFSLLNFDHSRVPSIMEERVTTYQALFFRTLQLEGIVPDTTTMNVLVLRHTDAKWAADLSDLPAVCKNEKEPPGSPEAVRDRIAEIPTRLTLPSECDRQLLTTAAAKLVAEHQATILEFVNRP